jgi:hypothetical protein
LVFLIFVLVCLLCSIVFRVDAFTHCSFQVFDAQSWFVCFFPSLSPSELLNGCVRSEYSIAERFYAAVGSEYVLRAFFDL